MRLVPIVLKPGSYSDSVTTSLGGQRGNGAVGGQLCLITNRIKDRQIYLLMY